MAVGTISALGYFIPIFAFLLVFIISFTIFKKTQILGEGEPLMFIVSTALSLLFVIGVILINFSKFASVWFSRGVLGLFLLSFVLIFVPWHKPWNFFGKKNVFSWIFVSLVIIFFIVSSSYIFNWVASSKNIGDWISGRWFGIILVLITLVIVNWRLKK
jgi:hypothetical protein